jgi:hypothetical protein
MAKKRPSIVRGIVAGMAAGITATLIMDQFQKLVAISQKQVEKQIKLHHGESLQQIEQNQQRAQHEADQQEGSTERVARKIATATGNTIPSSQKKASGQAVHYTFGTLMGVVYCISAEFVPQATTGAGTAFGTLLFLAADKVAVPAFQLAPSPQHAPRIDHLQHWAAHVVYGASLEGVRTLMRRIV